MATRFLRQTPQHQPREISRPAAGKQRAGAHEEASISEPR